MTPAISLDQALAEASTWPLRTLRDCQPLAVGQSNQSYLLVTDCGRYVLRLNSLEAQQLGANRQWEQRALTAIQGKPYAPEMVFCCPQYRYLICRYIEGSTWAEQAPTAAEYRQLNAVIHDYQGVPFVAPVIDYRRYLGDYYATASHRLSSEQLVRWQRFAPVLEQLVPGRYRASLCHHDLNPGNIIRTPQGLRLIDWEFARCGHLGVDLHSLRPELCDDDQIAEVLYWLNTLWQLNNSAIRHRE